MASVWRTAQRHAQPRMGIYWADLTLSAGTAWTASIISLMPSAPLPMVALALTIAVFAFYRANVHA